MGRLDMNFYLEQLKKRYTEASRKAKSQILNEFCATSGHHRKHAIRLLMGKRYGYSRRKTSGRKKEYLPGRLLPPLKQLWLATDQLCGKRLKVAIPLWLPLKQQIPIKTDQWDEKRPGFVEGDTVAHCGTSLRGNFVWSVTVTDIFSGWTENGATWNKGGHGVMKQIRLIEERLPFLILGWDSDNGGEFLNHHLLRYFQKRDNPVQFTRSRPYHSGDNAHGVLPPY